MDIRVREIIVNNIPLNTVRIDITHLIFNTQATFRIRLNPDTLAELPPVYITISGTEYKNWKNDDNYIIYLLLSKISVSKALNTNFLADPQILDPILLPIEPVVWPIFDQPVEAMVQQEESIENVVVDENVVFESSMTT